MLSIDELLHHAVWPINCIFWSFFAFINNLIVMTSNIFFLTKLFTVSKQSNNEFWHSKTMRVLRFLQFNVNPLPLFQKSRVPTTRWLRFQQKNSKSCHSIWVPLNLLLSESKRIVSHFSQVEHRVGKDVDSDILISSAVQQACRYPT